MSANPTHLIRGAVAGRERRINECTNPSFEVNVSLWDPPSGGTLTRVAGWGAAGSWAAEMLRVGLTSNDASIFHPAPGAYRSCAPGDKIAAFGQFKVGASNTASGTAPRVGVQFDDGSGSFGLASTFSSAGAWPAVGGTGQVSVVATAPALATRYRTRWLAVTSGTQTVDVLWDAILIEFAPEVRDYFDGNLAGCEFEGAANASRSRKPR